MQMFLKPISDQLERLDGIEWFNTITGKKEFTKVRCNLITADAPGQAEILNVQQFNGRFGCNNWEIKSKKKTKKIRTEKKKKKRIRIFPFCKINQLKLRTKKRMAKQAEIAPSKKDGHKTGVKGPTVVSKLPGIDISRAVNPEYMHSVLLGNVRQFLKYWIILPGLWKFAADALVSFNEVILKIMPPNMFSRYTRDITDFDQ